MATSLVNAAPSQIARDSGAQPEPQSHVWLWTWLFPSLGVVSLLLSCILWSLRKPMWGDEVFSYVELSDPSLRHLLSAVTRLGGAGMPLFYLTAWPWAHLFGFSDLSLRLYSSVGVCGAFLVLLVTLRRFVAPSAAFLGTAFGLFASLIVLDQNSEARGYGLYLFLCALAIAQLVKVAQSDRPRWSALALLALTQAGLVLGHVLGLVYAGLLLLALIVADAAQRRFRLRVYLWAIVGWLALVPWIPAIRASAAVGRPHGWIPIPTLVDLGSSLSLWLFTGLYWQMRPHSPQALIVGGWFCALTVVMALAITAARNIFTASREQRMLAMLGLSLAAAPVVLYLVSITITPVLLPRYLLPSTLGVAILAAVWANPARAGKGIAGFVLSGAVLLLPIATALLAHPEILNVHRVDSIAAGRPTVCDSLKDFLVMTRYTRSPGTPRYPLDADAAHNVPGVDADVRLMDNYEREGYFGGQLADRPDLPGQRPFLVLDNSGYPWFRIRIENNPHFTWKVLAEIDSSRRLIEVQPKP